MISFATEANITRVVEEIFDSFSPDLFGKKVLIKPNFVITADPERAITTHPSILKAILEVVRHYGGKPIVGDNGMRPKSGEIPGMNEACGQYLKNIGASSVLKNIGGYEVPISADVLEADFIINVPKFKSHVLTGISVCIKNMFGIIPGNYKSRMHAITGHAKVLTQFFVDLYKWRTPDFNIVDAIIGMEGNGPTSGSPREIGKVIAGYNGVEVDTVCAYMMGFGDPRSIKLLDLANQKGLGDIDLKKIDVTGDLEMIRDFEKPSTYTLHLKEAKKSVFAERAQDFFDVLDKLGHIIPQCDDEKCIQCGECEEVCPAGAINLDPYPVLNRGKCISCFCCSEICVSGAMKVLEGEEIEMR